MINKGIERKFIKPKIPIIIIICVVLIVGMIGVTYSFFVTEVSSKSGEIYGVVAMSELDISVTKLAPTSLNVDKGLVPQLDEYITKAVVGRNNNNCVDDNDNVVCQVYKITLKNLGSSSINVDGILELNAGNNKNLKWARISGGGTNGDEPEIIGKIKESWGTSLIVNELYNVNELKEYYIVLWISETGYVQEDNGIFTGKVTFYNHVKETAESTLSYLNSLGFTSEVSENNLMSFNSPEKNSSGLYATEDDIGISYYFRGAVENNYVKFGKNISNQDMYWRIIRINGDGTIRMIYDGTQIYANGVSSKDRQVGTSMYNSKYSDNGFLGYMNGTTNGINFPNGTTNSISYMEAHDNLTDSTIKEYLEGNDLSDGWYKDNIIDTGYAKYVADAIYCNDRTLTEKSDSSNYESLLVAMGYGSVISTNKPYGIGYGGVGTDNLSLYGLYGLRSMFSSDMTGWASATPTLKCNRQDDRFTVELKIEDINGNAKNKYPVGLITADETIFAGAYSSSNFKYYLYTGNTFWTSSSALFFDGVALSSYITTSGIADFVEVNKSCGVRPVISILPETLKYGIGTNDNPFRIEL